MQGHIIIYLNSKFIPYISSDLSCLSMSIALAVGQNW